MIPDRVECYSGHEYTERPYAIYWQGQRLDIAEILQDWRIPEGKRFQVRTSDLQVFELVYRESDDDWFINRIR